MIKKEADQYAIDSLDHLEIELSKILTQVRNGILSLKETTQDNLQESPRPPVNNQDQSVGSSLNKPLISRLNPLPEQPVLTRRPRKYFQLL